VLLPLLSSALFAVTASEAPDSPVIGDCVNKRSAVGFPHKAHIELTDCTSCHHTSEGLTAASDMEVPKCATCHFRPEKESTPGCLEMSIKTNPYHMVCIDCHKDTVAEGPASPAPTKCDACHPKDEG
jgi:hypothetical protein